MTEHHNTAPASLSEKIQEATGLNPADCYQCGKCSAGCPMAQEMKFAPSRIIRLVQLDRQKTLMEDDSIWCCLTCEMCTTRCPNQFDPARMIDGLREIAMKENAETPRKIGAFHRSFLDQIKSHGRLFELGLMIAYKLRSGALLDDVTAAPGTLMKGKLGLTPHKINGIDEVRRIFDACENQGEK